jgi:non-heme chloroperoxidase
MDRRDLFQSSGAGTVLAAASAFGFAAQPTSQPRNPTPSRRSVTKTIQCADRTRLYYRARGKGVPVVFVHGWAVNSDIWQYKMLALSSHARCVVYDKRGHGRSDDPGQGYDYDTLADDIWARWVRPRSCAI